MEAKCSPFSIHPMVDYLNSLRTQESDTNPSYVHENRRAYLEGLREKWQGFPRDDELHVTTRLDALATALAKGQIDVDALFLTGDAGDGKTAFCERVATELDSAGGRLGSSIETIGGWTIVKDASEIPVTGLIDLLEKHLLRRDGKTRLLLAINEGRLRRLFRSSLQSRPPLREVIDTALRPWLDFAEAKALDEKMAVERLMIVNFRHRFHVRTVLPGLLRAWTPPSFWEESPACSTCPARTTCPILANAVSLREHQVQDRLADVMTAVHFAGQRLPFRRLQALVALACTGGLRCEQVQGELAGPQATPAMRLRHRYYEAIFPSAGFDSLVPIHREPLCQSIAALDPGQRTSRTLDSAASALVLEEKLPVDAAIDGVQLEPMERAAAEQLSTQVRTASEPAAEDLAAELARFTRSLRRFHAFNGVGMNVAGWHRALTLLETFALDDHSTDLQKTVIGALNRLQRSPDRRDSLTDQQFDPGGFRNPERLALVLDLGVYFDCRLVRGPELPPTMCKPWMESCPSDIRLQAWPHGSPDHHAELTLDAHLIAALLSIEDGYTEHAGLGAYRRDIARFFSHLLQLATGTGRSPIIGLKVAGQTLRVTGVKTNGVARLQFLRGR